MRKAIQLAQGKVRVQNILLAIGQDKAGLMAKKLSLFKNHLTGENTTLVFSVVAINTTKR